MRTFWGGDPGIAVSLHEIKATLDEAAAAGCDVGACRDWLRDAERTFGDRICGFLPYGRYDRIWAIFNQIRHICCEILPPSFLLSVIVKIRGYISYLPSDEAKESCGRELDGAELSLRQIVTGHVSGMAATSPSLDDVRFVLQRLSRITADAREAQWRKVNLLRMRLFVTAIFLGVLLLGSIWIIPSFMSPATTPAHPLGVIVFGALGGLVSALRTMEPLDVPATSYYIQRTLLGLRPLIGAAAGLILYLIQISGIVSIIPATTHAGAAYLMLAFASGFSEKFFVAQISRLTEPAQSAASSHHNK